MKRLYFCATCKRYTMSEQCPLCKERTTLAKPAKYSPEDRWGEYRRRAKAEQANE